VNNIPIVKDFIKAFLVEKSKLPLKRKVEFLVDMMFRTGSVLVTPYHMASTELVELKK